MINVTRNARGKHGVAKQRMNLIQYNIIRYSTKEFINAFKVVPCRYKEDRFKYMATPLLSCFTGVISKVLVKIIFIILAAINSRLMTVNKGEYLVGLRVSVL